MTKLYLGEPYLDRHLKVLEMSRKEPNAVFTITGEYIEYQIQNEKVISITLLKEIDFDSLFNGKLWEDIEEPPAEKSGGSTKGE